MVTEIVLLVVTNTTATAATQNDFDIGDYTGIGALIATAITFFLTYSHGTRSEQTRIARETWEKISENNHKFNEILGKYKEINDITKEERIVPDLKNLSDVKKELDRRCEILLDHIEYYGFLVKHKHIKGKFTRYYSDRVLGVYERIEKIYEELFPGQVLPRQQLTELSEGYEAYYTTSLDLHYFDKFLL
jgi:hypothetical protein